MRQAKRTDIALSEQLEDAIKVIIQAGNKIEAIKRVRELTGAGLKEAKQYVDALASDMKRAR